MSTQTQQQSLVERLREGCILNQKRWSGEPTPVNEEATDQLLREAADEIERLRADLNRFSEWAEEACDVIVNGVSLMTVKQLQQWEGCRAVVETCPSLLHESQED